MYILSHQFLCAYLCAYMYLPSFLSTWKQLSDRERAPFLKMAQQDRDRVHELNLEVKKKVLSIAKDLHLLKAKPVYRKFAANYEVNIINNMAKTEGTALTQQQSQLHNPRDQQEMTEVSVLVACFVSFNILAAFFLFLILLLHDYFPLSSNT